MKMRRLGLLNIGTASNGSGLYLADADENTSDMYEVGVDSNGNTIYSYDASAVPSGNSTDFASAIGNFGTALASIYQSKSIIDINRDRLAKGMQPLSSQQTAALAPQARVGLTTDTQNMLIIAALIVGATVLLPMLKKH